MPVALVDRYYDPATGQFLTVDPDVDETGQPYAYAGGDPANGNDPTGDGPCWSCITNDIASVGEGLVCLINSCAHNTHQLENEGAGLGDGTLAGLGTNAYIAEPYPDEDPSGAQFAAGEIVGWSVTFGALGSAGSGEADGYVAFGSAEGGDDYVNLATEARTQHILEGDATGGGHLWPGAAGKTPFPASWSAGQIMNGISDIATDPSAWQNAVTQGSRSILTGVNNGVEIRVFVDTQTGDIVTGYPINLPRNP